MHNVTPIDPSLLARLEEGYSARPELGLWSSALSRTPLADAAFVPAAAAKLRPEFSGGVPPPGGGPHRPHPLRPGGRTISIHAPREGSD